jgi:hypothetical protein
MIKSLSLTAICLMTVLISTAQEGSGISATMRGNGKIYVVVAVALTILAGIVLYLVRLDRKISRLEKNINS